MSPQPFSPESQVFDRLPDGTPVHSYTLHGPTGIELEVLELGAIIRRLVIPDESGNRRDVVLGFTTIGPYLDSRGAFAGTMAGRIAGRVPEGRIQIDGETHQLPLNEGKNHLHGGIQAIDKQLWKGAPTQDDSGCPALSLSLQSTDGDNGYPGTIDITVTFTLTNDHALVIETDVRSDQPTPVSLTHHGYFNLAGEGTGSITDHTLSIQSDAVVAVADDMTLLGKRVHLDGQPCDLNSTKRIADFLPGLFEQHGDLYFLPQAGNKTTMQPVARLTDPASGQAMEVSTTNSCLQFYSGAGWDGSMKGKSGLPYQQFAGLCLETEEYPAATTQAGFGDIIVRPDQPQQHTTKFKFTSGNPA